jgi:DNA-directed RNA polymerase subunit RPC12/RpoP
MENKNWWCPQCREEVIPQHVTFEENHDIRCGGCGFKVMSENPNLFLKVWQFKNAPQKYKEYVKRVGVKVNEEESFIIYVPKNILQFGRNMAYLMLVDQLKYKEVEQRLIDGDYLFIGIVKL